MTKTNKKSFDLVTASIDDSIINEKNMLLENSKETIGEGTSKNDSISNNPDIKNTETSMVQGIHKIPIPITKKRTKISAPEKNPSSNKCRTKILINKNEQINSIIKDTFEEKTSESNLEPNIKENKSDSNYNSDLSNTPNKKDEDSVVVLAKSIINEIEPVRVFTKEVQFKKKPSLLAKKTSFSKNVKYYNCRIKQKNDNNSETNQITKPESSSCFQLISEERDSKISNKIGNKINLLKNKFKDVSDDDTNNNMVNRSSLLEDMGDDEIAKITHLQSISEHTVDKNDFEKRIKNLIKSNPKNRFEQKRINQMIQSLRMLKKIED